jgi:hypothetical protein
VLTGTGHSLLPACSRKAAYKHSEVRLFKKLVNETEKEILMIEKIIKLNY